MFSSRRICCAGFLVLATGIASTGQTQTSADSVPSLRSDPVPVVAADLERFVSQRIAEGVVVGVQVALIREGRVVWERGFGLANRVTREGVTPATIFPVASVGKPVAAYLALLEVDRERIALDEPLRKYLPRPWVGEGGAEISLRHVLTHTSGLSNFLRDRARQPKFKPGERFAYSGLGFMYLQEVLRNLRSESLDDTARAGLFAPLGMTHSYFGQAPTPRLPHATGHTRLRDLLIPVGILLGPGLLITLAAASLITRIARKRWWPSRICSVIAALVALAGVFAFLHSRAGSALLVAFFIVCGVALLLAAIAVGAALARILVRRVPARAAIPARIAGVALGFALVFLAALPQFVPLPDWFPEEGNVASSMRSTAGDLGRFLGELSRTHLLRNETATAFRTGAVRVNPDNSWGLGVGIQHSVNGDCLWHLGSNPASKAFFALYPERGLGVVVLTNSDGSLALAKEIAARALGGKAVWSMDPER